MKKIRIGIIGCGTIGTDIAKAACGRLRDRMELVAICDSDPAKTKSLQLSVGGGVKIGTCEEVVRLADLVVEAASAKVSAEVLEECVKSRKNCMIMSVGGILGNEKLLLDAKQAGVTVAIPSGAICGIDGLKSASIGGVDSVTITTTKPPKGLAGAPYLKEKNIDVMAFKDDTVVFDGSALEAIKAFPANINVSAVLSLAGIGSAKTRVRIVASPGAVRNTHEIEIAGRFGSIKTVTQNLPSETNPKTSALAIYSAIATLEAMASTVKIGT